MLFSVACLGRAALQLEGLRYASLQASGFSGCVRWEGDVVKLEETVLTQQNSRCVMRRFPTWPWFPVW